MLATQLTSNLWRTVGTTAALTIGLGLFVAMQTWGYSMLEPFVPGDWVPDLVVGLMPVGIPDSQIDSVRHVKGVVADQCAPLAVEQTKFAEDVTGARVRASSSRQDNCVMVGVDPEKAVVRESIEGDSWLYLTALHRAEVGLAQSVQRIASATPHPLPTIDVEKAIAWAEKKFSSSTFV